MKKATSILILAIFVLAGTAMAAEPAQKAPTSTTATAAQTPTTTTSTAAVPTDITADSREIRREFSTVLKQYPPEVGTILKLDPTLLNDERYMATYPQLAQFVAQHPEIAHNPGFYLEEVGDLTRSDPNPPAFRMWMQILGAIGGFAVFLVITSVLIWMIKTLIQQRRWSRLSRIQTEVHSKLLDRFTSNEELLAYIQTPAGRKFLESAPIQLDAAPAPISAPLGRISTSLQAGLVTAAAGIGLYFASMRFTPGAAEPLAAIAVVAIFVGIAFVLSAGAFYAIYRRFGLWQTPGLTAGTGSE